MDMKPILDNSNADFHYGRLTEIDRKCNIDIKFRLFELRKVLEALFKNITAKDRIFFDNTFSRIKFVCDKYRLSSQIQENIHGIRIFLNKVAHDNDLDICDEDYKKVMGVLAGMISYFSQIPVPDALKNYSQSFKADFPVQLEAKRSGYVAFTRAVITDISEKGKDRNGNDLYIISFENDDIGIFRVFLSDLQVHSRTAGSRYTLIGELARKYSSVNIFNIKNTRDNNYSVTPQSLFVLEPDFLIDVTDISGCFNNHDSTYMIFLLSKLISGRTSKAMLQGKIINDIFDEMVFDPGIEINDVIRESIFGNVLLSLSIGFNAISEIMKTIKKIHYNNLRKTIVNFIAKDLEKKNIKLEPSFISALYGIQGRLDALISLRDDPLHKDIVELKSGSSPDSGVWENHKMQVICYNMLLKSMYGETRKGSSYILYSGNSETPVREVPFISGYEKEICMIRNQIVSLVWDIAGGNTESLKRINIRDFGNCPPYKHNDIALFDYCYNSADELEKAYYNAYISFIFRELIASKVGGEDSDSGRYQGFAQLWKASYETKNDTYNILSNLVFGDFDKENNEISFSPSELPVSNFRTGDIAVLYPQQEDNSFPLDTELIRGSITQIDEKKVKLRIKNRVNYLDELTAQKTWVIEHDYFEAGYYNLCKSLYDFLGAERRLRELVLCQRKPEVNYPENSVNKEGYNSSAVFLKDLESNGRITKIQAEILERMLRSRDYFLLQGPPGTGKTSIILLNLARMLTLYFGEKIAVLAYTNRAVGEICEKLKDSRIDFLRLGGGYSDEDYLLRNRIEGKKLKEVRDMVSSTNIIVSTVSTFNARQCDLLSIKAFDTVIVDESSQLLEPQLAGIITKFRRFFLIGDQNQLPAISVQEDSACITQDPLLNKIGIKDLRCSLFERLYSANREKGWHECIGMLQDQYRMHISIAELINHYYDNRLLSRLSVQMEKENPFCLHRNNDLNRILGLSRTVFIESPVEQTPKTNTLEAKWTALIIDAVKDLYGEQFCQDTVGVITPWRAQANEIKKYLNPALSALVTVDTVERFQGSERDIILFSLAVCHKSQLNLISNVSAGNSEKAVDRKLNVAVSRAKRHLIILGNAGILNTSRHFSQIISKIRTRGGYINLRDAEAVFEQYFTAPPASC